jgi:pimeloyl-ACP methyl ester carboxylesterase
VAARDRPARRPPPLRGHRLPLYGRTPAAGGQDFSLPGFARFLADFCDALQLNDIDLVANDTGGAISQAFAAGHASAWLWSRWRSAFGSKFP